MSVIKKLHPHATLIHRQTQTQGPAQPPGARAVQPKMPAGRPPAPPPPRPKPHAPPHAPRAAQVKPCAARPDVKTPPQPRSLAASASALRVPTPRAPTPPRPVPPQTALQRMKAAGCAAPACRAAGAHAHTPRTAFTGAPTPPKPPSAQAVKRPQAPPVYRPQSAAAQPKLVGPPAAAPKRAATPTAATAQPPRHVRGVLQRKVGAGVIQRVWLRRGQHWTHFEGDEPPKAGVWLHYGEMLGGEKVYEQVIGNEMPLMDKSKDFHYGINPPHGETLGHRAKSMARYGGSVGEYTFSPNSYPHAQKPNPEIDDYQMDFNANQEVSAKHVGKYTGDGIDNFMTPQQTLSKYVDYNDNANEETEDQFGDLIGTRFSKGVIAYAASKGGSIMFHLDGMGTKTELMQILTKQHPKYSDAVTSRELRFVYKYWHGGLYVPGLNHEVRMEDIVVFYKNNRTVHPPWFKAYQD